jgi:hypothetical protein
MSGGEDETALPAADDGESNYPQQTGKVVSIVRPVCVFTDVPVRTRSQIMALLHGRWRTRLIMVLLSAADMPAAEIADLPDRPRSGRPPSGGATLTSRIATLLATPGPWTIRRVWRHLGHPAVSLRTVWRRTRTVARWRRPRLVASGDPTTTGSWRVSAASPDCRLAWPSTAAFGGRGHTNGRGR